MSKKINTADASREMMGVGSIINVNHKGPTKDPVGNKVIRDIGDYSPGTSLTPEDFRREKEERRKKEEREKLLKELAKRGIREEDLL